MGLARAALLAALALWWWAAPSWGREDVDTLVRALDAERAAQAVPGLAITLVEGDRVLWAGGLGVMDLDSRLPVTHDTLFRIGSITKIFTALALLQLQEAGRLRLDDTLRRHAPELAVRNDWDATHPITLAMLLEHTAGLQDLTREEFDNNDATPLTLEQALALHPQARVARWKPGLHASYSNAGYGLAGRVIELVTGVSYEQVIQTRLFDPLGMTHSGFFLDATVRDRLATGYAPNGRDTLPYWHMIMRPFGGIHTSARDMAPFLRMLLNDGRVGDRIIVSASSLRRAEHPATTLAARAGLEFGYGLGLNAQLRNGVRLLGHSGDADGYLSFIAYSRELGLAYFLSINRFHWPALRALRRVVENWITRDQPVTLPPPASVPAEVLSQYPGHYRPATRRFDWQAQETPADEDLRVELDGGTLYTRHGDALRRALVPVDVQRFRRDDEPCATSAFVRDEDGKLYFQEDDAYAQQ